MKFKYLIILIPLALIGCAQSAPPPPPEPVGELVPLNPPVIYRYDLEH
ncbi:hypothetical protein [Photobacterium damselae]|nr:hypothetical protein [Photobacterium damselae]